MKNDSCLFAAKPIERIRVGVVGLGCRGGMAMERLPIIPGVEVTALCEIRPHLVAAQQEKLRKNGLRLTREFVGPGKQRRVRAAASLWLAAHDTELQPRFDVIEIYGTEDMPYRKLQIHQIENAFE